MVRFTFQLFHVCGVAHAIDAWGDNVSDALARAPAERDADRSVMSTRDCRGVRRRLRGGGWRAVHHCSTQRE